MPPGSTSAGGGASSSIATRRPEHLFSCLPGFFYSAVLYRWGLAASLRTESKVGEVAEVVDAKSGSFEAEGTAIRFNTVPELVSSQTEPGGREERSGRWTCISCRAAFASSEEQRSHFKLDYHRLNIRLRHSDIKERTFKQDDLNSPSTLQLDLVSWNRRIARHVKSGEHEKAVALFDQMENERVHPNAYTYVPLLNACASLKDIRRGKRIHAQVIRDRLEANIFVGNALLDMYGKCGSIESAWKVFSKMQVRDVVSWNSIILGHVKCGQACKALGLFQQMQQEDGVRPNRVTFVHVLAACAAVKALDIGRHVHSQIHQSGFQSDLYLENCLVDMYVKCGSVENALGVFNTMPKRDVVSWSCLILGLSKGGQSRQALDQYRQMQEQDGIAPNKFTFVAALHACSTLGSLEEGRHIHEQVSQSDYKADAYISNSLIDMYSKCGSIEDAWAVFDRTRKRSIITWNAMIFGLVKSCQGLRALELCEQMQSAGVSPDRATYLGMLAACATVPSLEGGRQIHSRIIKSGLEADIYVRSSLIDMYAKCGSVEDAERVFHALPAQNNVVAWNTMIRGYAMHGYANEAQKCFERMCEEGAKIDEVTYIALLTACSQAGLVEEGLHYFELMKTAYDVHLTVEHYACIVDLLGRAGRVHEARDLIETMPFDPVGCVWTSLLSACRVHGHVQLGKDVAKSFLDLEPDNAAGYVLLSNMYVAAGMLDSSETVKLERMQRQVKKSPGLTWLEVNGVMHSFMANDCRHPQISEIRDQLERLMLQMKEAGYEPDTKFMLHNVDQERGEVQLCHHSEKLAITFGLLATRSRSPLYIFKNLRVCGDCHTFTKFISKSEKRRIIVRDASRFHHFGGGLCSCRDYW